MSEHKITVAGGSSVRLPTAGKYCDRDIVVTAQGGGVELPTLTNPAEESDVLMGKQFIDGDGNRGEGCLPLEVVTPEWEAYVPVEKVRDSSDVYLRMTSLGGFGDAAPEDVAAGKTFTSAEGFRQTGTAQTGGGLETVDVTFTFWGSGWVYYMAADGTVKKLEYPYEQTVAVVKNSPVIVGYDDNYGSTYLVCRDSSGCEILYVNNGIPGYSCEILSFYEDGYVLYEEV